jgi:hypothetical protein
MIGEGTGRDNGPDRVSCYLWLWMASLWSLRRRRGSAGDGKKLEYLFPNTCFNECFSYDISICNVHDSCYNRQVHHGCRAEEADIRAEKLFNLSQKSWHQSHTFRSCRTRIYHSNTLNSIIIQIHTRNLRVQTPQKIPKVSHQPSPHSDSSDHPHFPAQTRSRL